MESGGDLLFRAVSSQVPSALKGSAAEAPPVADEARRRRLAKQAMRTAVSSAPIEPDGREQV